MVAPAVCDGHVRRSLVRVSSRMTDMNAGVVVVDLSRGSSLAAMVPVNSNLDPVNSSSSLSSNQSLKTHTPAATAVPWANTMPMTRQSTAAAQNSVRSTTTTTAAAARGQSSQRPVNTVSNRPVIPLLSAVQRQLGGSGGSVNTLTPGLNTVGTPASTSRLNTVGTPALTGSSSGRVNQFPASRPRASGSTQGQQRIGVLTRAPTSPRTAGTQVSGKVVAAAVRAMQRGNARVASPPLGTGKRQLEEGNSEEVPSVSVTRPAKVSRTNTTTTARPLVPCSHNPHLVEENQRLRQVVQGLLHELGRYQLLLQRSEAVRTGVAVH